jgi:hypothetical protein
MQYKDKKEFINEETGKLDYDSYFLSDKETLTRYDLYDVIDDLNETWFKRKLILSIDMAYQYFTDYIDIAEYELENVTQVHIYGKISSICSEYGYILDEPSDTVLKQYPTLVDELNEIHNNFLKTCKNGQKYNKIYEDVFEDFSKFTPFELFGENKILYLLNKYAVFEPLKEYIKFGGTLY